jgi:hypothetical protein
MINTVFWSVTSYSLISIFQPSGGNIIYIENTGHDITERDITGRDITGHDITGRDITGRAITGHDITGHDVPEESFLNSSNYVQHYTLPYV